MAASKEHRVPGLAAETAFFAVLGIFPALLIAAGLLGMLDVIVLALLLGGELNALLHRETGPARDEQR